MEKAKLVSYDWTTLDEGWLGWQLSSTSQLPHLAVSNKPGSTISFKFKGSQVASTTSSARIRGTWSSPSTEATGRKR